MGIGAVVGLMSASTAMSAGSSFFSGRYNQQIADMNADMADAQARDAITRGQEEERRHRQSVQGLIGRQRAALAAQGVDVNSGSALDVQADAAKFGALDAVTIRNNAAREAWGYRVQAANYKAEGRLAFNRGMLDAGGTLLGGAASTYMAYKQLKAME